MERYLRSAVAADLEAKIVLLSGPGQCGRTTLARMTIAPGLVFGPCLGVSAEPCGPDGQNAADAVLPRRGLQTRGPIADRERCVDPRVLANRSHVVALVPPFCCPRSQRRACAAASAGEHAHLEFVA